MEDWVIKAMELYKADKKATYASIGRELGIDRKRVAFVLKENGCPPKLKRPQRNVTARKYTLDENIFENIDCEEKAYWLGFLYADGYVSNTKNDVSIMLAEKDKEHLHKFKKFMGSSHPITEKNKKVGDKVYRGWRITLTSMKLKEDLISKGCMPRKGLLIKFPTEEIVPSKWRNHFVRGYFDGDGHCRYDEKKKCFLVEVVGNNSFIRGLAENVGMENTYRFNHTEKVIRFSVSTSKAQRFLDYIYEDATVFLKRKEATYRLASQK